MKRTTIMCSALVMTLGLALSVPGSANATDGGPAPKHATHAYHVAHRQTIPVSAEALAPVPRPVRETDGLSRNVEDCTMGCVDN
jgi:hypothetical protein